MKFGSREWQLKYNPRYKGKKSRSRRLIRRSETRSVSMAKHRRSGKGGSLGFGGGMVNSLLGAVAFSFIASKVSMVRSPLVQVVGGAVLKGKGGIPGAIGNAAFTVGAVQLSQSLLGGSSLGSTATEVFG